MYSRKSNTVDYLCYSCGECDFEKILNNERQYKLCNRLHKKSCPKTGRKQKSEISSQWRNKLQKTHKINKEVEIDTNNDVVKIEIQLN